jgi:hypothetical protein
MRISSRRWVYLTAIVADLALATLVACGSGTDMSSSEGGSDGGRDGATSHRGDAARSDGPTGDAVEDVADGSAPSPGAGAVAYCEAVWMTDERCKLESPACIAAYFDASFEAGLEKYLAECAVGWSEFESNAYLGALAKCIVGTIDCCAFTGACTDAAISQALEAGPCIARGLEIPPDPEDEKLKAEYCKVCPDTASKYPTCSGFFSFAEAGILDSSFFDASTLPYDIDFGFGSYVMALSDPVVAAIDEACTGSALAAYDAGEGVTDCYERFVSCSQAALQAYVKARTPALDAASIPPACRMDGG